MKSGLYQMSFRGLTLSEAWRFGRDPFKFFIALILKLIGYKGPVYRLPSHENEKICKEDELSDDAQETLLDVVKEAKELGYSNGQFFTVKENWDRSMQETFTYIALHQDRKRTIAISYVKSEVNGMATKKIAISGSLASYESDDIDFVNHGFYMDGLPTSRKIKVRAKGLDAVNSAMLDYMMTLRSVRTFENFSEMKSHANKIDIKTWDSRIARGLMILKEESEPQNLTI